MRPVCNTAMNYSVFWSDEDQEFVGTCSEFPSLSHLAETRAEAMQGIEALVQDVIVDLQESGEPVPYIRHDSK